MDEDPFTKGEMDHYLINQAIKNLDSAQSAGVSVDQSEARINDQLLRAEK